VDPEPECRVAVRRTVDDDAAGVREHGRVTVGSRKRQHHAQHPPTIEATFVDDQHLDERINSS